MFNDLVFVLALLLGGGSPRPAECGPITISPSSIRVNAPATVTVTVHIDHPDLMPNGLTLLRVAEDGAHPLIVGIMHDDGLNGDTIAGDHVYSLKVQLTESSAGVIHFQVSGVFKRMLRRVRSPLSTLEVKQEWTHLKVKGRCTHSPLV